MILLLKYRNKKRSWLVDTGASISTIKSLDVSQYIPIHRDRIRIKAISVKKYSDGLVYKHCELPMTLFINISST